MHLIKLCIPLNCQRLQTLTKNDMNTITNDHDKAGYSKEQAAKVLELLDSHHLSAVNFKRIECFQYDGLIFKGNYDIAVGYFVNQTEITDFLAFLKDTHYQFCFKD